VYSRRRDRCGEGTSCWQRTGALRWRRRVQIEEGHREPSGLDRTRVSWIREFSRSSVNSFPELFFPCSHFL
jgi:hypothetical protein